MIDLDRWQEIYFTLKQYKMRTGLTAFGVFWGIFMLVVLLGMGKGLQAGAISNFGGELNTVFIWGAGRTQIPYKGMPTGRKLRLKDADIEAIRAKIPELAALTGNNDLNGWQNTLYIVRGNQSGTYGVRGVEPSYFPISHSEILLGRAINDFDFREKRKVAVIGTTVRDVLFKPGENIIGESLKIQGVDFQVIGVFKSKATGDRAREEAERILLPNSSQRQTFNQMGWIGYLQFVPKPGIHAAVLEEKVKALLMERQKIHPEDRGVIGSWNAQKEVDKVMGLFNGIRTFSWVVAIGTIIAGVIGVGNIMLIIVKERTREIGVRKALGAKASDIVTTIVQESLVLTILAGYLGLVAGVFALEGLGHLLESNKEMMFGKAEIDFSTAGLALLALIIAGALGIDITRFESG